MRVAALAAARLPLLRARRGRISAPGLTVVHGPNGAGKTNLLEALYFGCTGRSPRTRNERELVRFGARRRASSCARPTARAPHELASASSPGEPKRMSADGAPVERLLDVATRPLLSVFAPDRLELIKGAPGRAPRAPRPVRRRALAGAAATAAPTARPRAAQRAARRHPRGPRLARDALAPGTPARGRRVALREHRARAVALLAEPFAEHAAQLGLTGEARLDYRPRSRAADERASSSPSCRRAWRATWRAASPRTVRTATSSRCCATGASCASTARRASSAWPCSRCCWPSARRSRASAAARR